MQITFMWSSSTPCAAEKWSLISAAWLPRTVFAQGAAPAPAPVPSRAVPGCAGAPRGRRRDQRAGIAGGGVKRVLRDNGRLLPGGAKRVGHIVLQATPAVIGRDAYVHARSPL